MRAWGVGRHAFPGRPPHSTAHAAVWEVATHIEGLFRRAVGDLLDRPTTVVELNDTESWTILNQIARWHSVVDRAQEGGRTPKRVSVNRRPDQCWNVRRLWTEDVWRVVRPTLPWIDDEPYQCLMGELKVERDRALASLPAAEESPAATVGLTENQLRACPVTKALWPCT